MVPGLLGIPGKRFRLVRGFKFLISTPLLRESATIADKGEESVEVNGPGMKSVMECLERRCAPSGVCGAIAISSCDALGGVRGRSGW